jgi:hypothetical protein
MFFFQKRSLQKNDRQNNNTQKKYKNENRPHKNEIKNRRLDYNDHLCFKRLSNKGILMGYS